MRHFGKNKFSTRILLLVTAVFVVGAMASAGWAADGDLVALGADTTKDGRNNIGITKNGASYTTDAYYIGDAGTKLTVAISADFGGIASGVISGDSSSTNGDVAFSTMTATSNVKTVLTVENWTATTPVVIKNIGLYTDGTNDPIAPNIISVDLTIVPTKVVPTVNPAGVSFTIGDTTASSEDIVISSNVTNATSFDFTGASLMLNSVTVGDVATNLWDIATRVYVKAKKDGAVVTGFYVSPDVPGQVRVSDTLDIIVGAANGLKFGAYPQVLVASAANAKLAELTAKVDPANITLAPDSRTFKINIAATSADQVDVSINPASLGPNPVSLDLLDGTTASTSFTVNGTLTITASSSDHKIKFSGIPSAATSSPKTYKVRWLTATGMVLSKDLSISVDAASTARLLMFTPETPKYYTGDTTHLSIKASVPSLPVKPITGLKIAASSTATSQDIVSFNGLNFTASVKPETSPDAYIDVANVSGSIVTTGKMTLRVYAMVDGTVLSKDLPIEIVNGTSSNLSVSPESMTFADYTPQTLTITAPTSSLPPTATAADTTLLAVGERKSSSTGVYTVTITPMSGAFGTSDKSTSVFVTLGSENPKIVPVTLTGSGTAPAPSWTTPTAAQLTVIAGIAGVSNTAPILQESASTTMPDDIDYGYVDRKRVAAYLEFAQSIPSGGAGVMYFNGGYFMTLNTTGVGTNVNQHLHLPTSNADFQAYYDVVKVFNERDSINLSNLIPGFFRYDENTRTVTANGVIAIVDGPAPKSAPSGFTLVKPSDDSIYGVLYARNYGGTAYFIIFDGVKDGVAKDPIMLVQQYGESSSSGGGCAAGFGAFALVALGGIALLRRRNG